MVNPIWRLRLALVALAAAVGLLALAIGIVVLGVHLARSWAAFAGAAAGIVLLLALLAASSRQVAWWLRRACVVEIDLPVMPPERRASRLARLVGARGLTLADVVQALERASTDPRVIGALVLPRFSSAGLAQVQELRDALARFQAAGKPVVAFADTFGDLAAGNASYYLATACAEIALQPTGTVGLVGLAREATFARRALDRLAVEPIFEGRREYKTAATRLTEERYTEPDREQQQRLVDAQLDQVVTGVAAGRRLPAAEVRALVDRGPFLAGEALAARLVDRLCYRDEALDLLAQRAGRGARTCPLADYARLAPRRPPGSGRPVTVAVLTVTGPIARSTEPRRSTLGGRPTDASKAAAAVEAAAASKRIRAILLRLDSPGGSPVASDTIRRTLVRARQAGTPVVVSMGNLAASGAYYLAAGADWIVAQPGSLTGSIGVFAGKLVVGGAKDGVGLSSDEVHAGAHALIGSPNRAYSASEHERLSALLDAFYADFLARVAEGRSMSLGDVEAIARGRVWTAADARDLGLVDALGGFAEALAAIRERAGLPPGCRLRLAPTELGTGTVSSLRGAQADGWRAHGLRAAVALLGRLTGLGAGGGDGLLCLPEDGERWFLR